MLCIVCEALFKGEWHPLGSDHGGLRAHHSSFGSFYNSVRTGCRICTSLYDTPEVQRKLAQLSTSTSPILNCRLCEVKETPDNSFVEFDLRFYAKPYVDAADDNKLGDLDFKVEYQQNDNIYVGELSSTTNSPTVFERIRSWINSCLTDHEVCNIDTDQSWRPTRLVDLGDPKAEREPRLVETEQYSYTTNAQIESYATLSHCWGTLKMPKCTQNDFEFFHEFIPLDSLPKTFQHAMAICKNLGVRYLWIDSLCIIQDSLEDWQKESSTMHLVYRHAHFNIAATGAEDGSQGCFFNRNPSAFNATSVKPEWSRASGKSYVVVQHTPKLQQLLLGSPLLKRSWVLQERILSRRVIHFAREQVFFECRKGLVCEVYPNGIPDTHGDHCVSCRIRLNEKPIWIHRAILPDEVRRRGIPKDAIEWNSIVETYTSCGLTDPADKIVALSGIAGFLERTIHKDRSQYLAGLWSSHFPDTLLWTPTWTDPWRRETRCVRSSSYRAPSWSWASLDGPISMRGTDREVNRVVVSLAELWEKSVTLVNEANPTGPVQSAHIKLFGLFCELAWICANEDEKSGYVLTKMSHLRKDLRFRKGTRLNTYVEFDTEELAHEAEKANSKVSLIFVRYNAPQGNSFLDTILRGIVLKNLGDGTYERIGYFGVNGRLGPLAEEDDERNQNNIFGATCYTIGGLLKFLRYPEAKVVKIV